MCSKLDQAIKGQTVKVTWQEVGLSYDNKSGFPSVADLQNWCTCFGLTLTPNPETYSYTISKTA